MTMNETEKYPVQQEEAGQDDSAKRPAVQKVPKPRAWLEPKLKRGKLRRLPWKPILAFLIMAWALVPLAAIIFQDEGPILAALGVAIVASVLLVLAFFYLVITSWLRLIPEEKLIIETYGDFCEVRGFRGKLPRLMRMPETYRGMKITAIDGGFAKNRRLRTVVMQGEIATLPEGCFAGCRNLEEVRLPQALTAIPAGMMEKCTRLAAVYVPAKVQSIGSRAFADCALLRDVYLTSAVQEIAGNAFDGCRDMMFHVQPGSEAERFAREKGINFSYQ